MAVARTTSSITGSNSLLQNEFVLRASIDDNDINKASSFSSPSEENLPSSNINSNNGIDVSQDPRLYKVRLSRATGIEYVLLQNVD